MERLYRKSARRPDGPELAALCERCWLPVYRLAYSLTQSRQEAEEVAIRTAPDPLPGPEEEAVTSDEYRMVLAALEQLSAGQRQVLEMRLLQGLSAKECAEHLGLSVGAVRVAQCRALQAVRSLLEGEVQMR